MSSADERRPIKLRGIEAMRGIACMLVVLHHAGSISSEQRFFGYEPFANHLANFNVGVDFFFVLSGFIITWIHWPDLGRPKQFTSYLRKRFLRIYPVYWTVLIPLTLLYLIIPTDSGGADVNPVRFLTSLFLIPNQGQPILGVAWTLVHEMVFYVVFGFLILANRRFAYLLIVWAIAIVATAFSPVPVSFPAKFFLSSFNLEFLMGIGTALLLRKAVMPYPGWLLGTGASLFLYCMLFEMHIQDFSLLGRAAFGGASCLIILGLVEIERHQALKIPSLFVYLGAGSYAIYLVHPIVLSMTMSLIRRFHVPHYISGESAVVVLALFAIMSGLGYHYVVEKPLNGFIQRLSLSLKK